MEINFKKYFWTDYLVVAIAFGAFCFNVIAGPSVTGGGGGGGSALSEEQVEDFVGGMLGGTETGISVSYNDEDNDIDFVVSSILQKYHAIDPADDVELLLGCANEAAIRTLLDLEPGVDFHALDADLTNIAGDDTWMIYYKNGSAVLTDVALSAANKFFMSNGASSAPTFESVTDALLVTTDITTNNATTSKHGFRAKLTNVVYSYLDETGTVRAGVTVPAAPGADKLLLYDHSALAFVFPTLTGLSISGTVVTASTKDVDEDIWQAVYVTAAGFECDGTNCVDPAAAQINSGPNQYYTACSDAAGTIEFSIGMPENWDGGSIIIEPVVFSVEGTQAGTHEWELSIQKCASDEAIDNTWVTTNGNVYFEDAETANTTIDTQYDLFKCKNKTAMAAGGGTGGDQLFVKLTRDNDDATHDTSTQTVNVLGVKVYYQIDDLDEKD